MKTLLLSTLILLVGCGTPKHIRKYNRAKDKLLTKGIVVPKDTVTVTNSDTIRYETMRNDTVMIREVVTKEITLEPTIEVKTRWQTKIEYKERIKIVKAEVKKEKQKTKQQRKRRSQWYLLFIGLGLGFVLNLYIKKLFVS